MDAGTSPARQSRSRHRHELRTLTYVTLDQANGGIVRNLSRDGIGVQAVAAVRPLQEVRVRFELRYPKLRVETRGHVIWSTFSGQCGIQFLDLSPKMVHQIQEWIFGNLLEGASVHAERTMFAPLHVLDNNEVALGLTREEDGLLLSSTARKPIELPRSAPPTPQSSVLDLVSEEDAPPLAWLSQPLSGLGLTWTVNVLAVVAGLLLFALIFLSVTHEAPSWPVIIAGAAVVPAMYWGFFQLFGGCSLGARLARLATAAADDEQEAPGARFR